MTYVLLYALAGLLASGHAPVPYAKAISGWFEHRRGLALGIAMAGIGIGLTVTPQVARALITAFDWRMTYVGLGAITWLVAFPAVYLFIKDPSLGLAVQKSTWSRAMSGFRHSSKGLLVDVDRCVSRGDCGEWRHGTSLSHCSQIVACLPLRRFQC